MSLHVIELHAIALHVIALHVIAWHDMAFHCMSDTCHALHLAFTCNKPYTVFAKSLDNFELDEI